MSNSHLPQGTTNPTLAPSRSLSHMALWQRILHVRLPFHSDIISPRVYFVENILSSPSQFCPAPVRQQNACMCNFWPGGFDERKVTVRMCAPSTCANMFSVSLVWRCVWARNALCFWTANLCVLSSRRLGAGSEVTAHIVPIWKPLFQLCSTKAGHSELFVMTAKDPSRVNNTASKPIN